MSTATETRLRWPLTNAEIDALPERELDAYVEQVCFGHEIVGFAPVEINQDSGAEYVWDGDPEGRYRAGIYLDKCGGEHDPGDDPLILGHAFCCWTPARRFSTDWATMQPIAEWVQEKEYGKVSISVSHYRGIHSWACWGPGLDGESRKDSTLSCGDTAPIALCRAVLKACVGAKSEEDLLAEHAARMKAATTH